MNIQTKKNKKKGNYNKIIRGFQSHENIISKLLVLRWSLKVENSSVMMVIGRKVIWDFTVSNVMLTVYQAPGDY